MTVFLGFLAMSVGIMLCMLLPVWWLRKGQLKRLREFELHAPLLADSSEHRLDAALREAEEGFNRCNLCGFENFKRFPFCSVCGESVMLEEEEATQNANQSTKSGARKKRLWKNETSSVEIVQRNRPHQRIAVTQRQQRAMYMLSAQDFAPRGKRREWVRRIDVNGNLFWYRDGSSGADLRFPGYLLAYSGDDDRANTVQERETIAKKPVEESNGVPREEETHSLAVVVDAVREPHEINSTPGSNTATEPDPELSPHGSARASGASTTQVQVTKAQRVQELNKLATLTAMEVVESPLANPSHLPLVHASDSTLQWKDVLTFAGQDFPTKYAHFVTTSAGLIVPSEREILKLNMTRDNLFEDSMESLSNISAKHIRSVIRINFLDELGIDAGGVHREWFVLLNEQLVDPSCGVFRCMNKQEQTFSLNPNSLHDLGENHLMYYFATGRLIGRALLEGFVMGFHLSLPLMKIVLGLPVTFSDLEYFDPEAYKSLLWLIENDGVESLGLDFSITEKRGDAIVSVDLIPNGRSIDVTDDNKDEYLERRFRYMVFESVSSQLYVFLKGIYEVVPQELLMLFDPEEFDYLLCGSDEIDVDDWERNTRYTAGLRRHQAMIWFWELVREMPNEYRRRLLHFATGSSRVPIAGFSSLTSYDGRLCPFTLKGVKLVDDGYIWSHACFNRLDLPLHVSRTQLKAVLYAAIETEMYGFTTD